MKFLIDQLRVFGCHSTKFNCNASNMVFQYETRKGFVSELHFKCNFCGETEAIFSECPSEEQMKVNMATVSIFFYK